MAHLRCSAANRTGGLIASDLVMNYFDKTEIGESLENIILRANKELNADMVQKEIDISAGVNRFSTAVSAVKILPDSFEWLNIGDSMIIQININGSFQLVSPYHNHDVAVLSLTKDLVQQGVLISEIFDNPEFKAASVILQNNRNVDYGVLDGSENATDFISTGNIPLTGVKSILLLTDGCYIPQETPSDEESLLELVNLYQNGGLQSIYDYVKNIQDNDPNCEKYIRYKKADDFSAVAIDFV